jgi:hypothetical protein
MIIVQFHENSEQYIGFANAASALGIIVGPFFALFFNMLKPYLTCFVGYAVVQVVLGMVTMVFIPNSLNKSDTRELKTRFDSRYSF